MAKKKKILAVDELLRSKGIDIKKSPELDSENVSRGTFSKRLYSIPTDSRESALTGFNGFQPVETGFNKEGKVNPEVETSHETGFKGSQSASNGCNRIQQVSNENARPNQTETGFNGFQTDSTGFNDIQTKPVSMGFNRDQETVSTGVNSIQPASVKPIEPRSQPVETGSNRYQIRPSASELRVLLFFQNLKEGTGVKKHQIADATGLKLSGVKTALIRLKTKGFINLVDCSGGRFTGFTIYQLTALAFEFLSSRQAIDMVALNRFQPVSTGGSYSSSNINNTITRDLDLIIPKPLQDLGVTTKAFFSFIDSGLTTSEIQESIDNMSYDMQNGLMPETKNPLKLLFGLLKKGKPYLSLQHAEATNRDINEALKRAEQASEKLKALEDAKFKAAFYEWRFNNPEDVENALTGSPSYNAIKGNKMLVESFLMEHYRKIAAEQTDAD